MNPGFLHWETVNHYRLGSAPEGGGWGWARRRLWAAAGRGLTHASEGQRAEHEVHDDVIACDTTTGRPVDHPLDELRGRAEAPGQLRPAQDTSSSRSDPTSKHGTGRLSAAHQVLQGSNAEVAEHPSNHCSTPEPTARASLIRDCSGSIPGLKNC